MSEPAFNSTGVIVFLSVLFVVVGVSTSLVYYFARYYFKTDPNDKELLTTKPLEVGLETTPSAVTAPQPPPTAAKTLDESLAASKQNIWGRLKNVFKAGMDGQLRDQVEEVLYTSDLGPQTAEMLLAKVTEGLRSSDADKVGVVHAALRAEMLKLLKPSQGFSLSWQKASDGRPVVWMVVGVNGAGKTTTIGKLASHAQQQGLKVLIVAGDTFRAAADSQLRAWAERAQCAIFSPENVKDPSAVTYAALEKAKSENFDLVIVDTAGRLHTQEHLMEELKKVKRVMTKVLPQAPEQTLLVIDANAGQNSLEQARQFHAAVGLTAVVLTKLDGSSKAGVALGVSHELGLPISHIGVGEGVEDLKPFQPESFVAAII